MKDFLVKMITARSGISSKRVCGVLGWLVCLISAIYCLIKGVQAPNVIDTILYCCIALLGVDSVTSIFKNNA